MFAKTKSVVSTYVLCFVIGYVEVTLRFVHTAACVYSDDLIIVKLVAAVVINKSKVLMSNIHRYEFPKLPHRDTYGTDSNTMHNCVNSSIVELKLYR